MEQSAEAQVAREWTISAYKARLDSAIEMERWDEADRVRVAIKQRLLEMMSRGGSENEMSAARDLLAEASFSLRLSSGVEITNDALTTAVKLLVDAETAAVAVEHVALPQSTARDVKERLLQILSETNRRPWCTSDLAKATSRSVETVSRALSQLRAERKIISRRSGRNVLHRLAEVQSNTVSTVVSKVVSKVPVGNPVRVSTGVKILGQKQVRLADRYIEGYEAEVKRAAIKERVSAFRAAESNEISSIRAQADEGGRYSASTSRDDLQVREKQPLISQI